MGRCPSKPTWIPASTHPDWATLGCGGLCKQSPLSNLLKRGEWSFLPPELLWKSDMLVLTKRQRAQWSERQEQALWLSLDVAHHLWTCYQRNGWFYKRNSEWICVRTLTASYTTHYVTTQRALERHHEQPGDTTRNFPTANLQVQGQPALPTFCEVSQGPWLPCHGCTEDHLGRLGGGVPTSKIKHPPPDISRWRALLKKDPEYLQTMIAKPFTCGRNKSIDVPPSQASIQEPAVLCGLGNHHRRELWLFPAGPLETCRGDFGLSQSLEGSSRHTVGRRSQS